MLSYRFPTWARYVTAVLALLASCATAYGVWLALSDLPDTDEFLDGLGVWLGLVAIALSTPCLMVATFVWLTQPIRAALFVAAVLCVLSAGLALAFSSGNHVDEGAMWVVTCITIGLAAITAGAMAAARSGAVARV